MFGQALAPFLQLGRGYNRRRTPQFDEEAFYQKRAGQPLRPGSSPGLRETEGMPSQEDVAARKRKRRDVRQEAMDERAALLAERSPEDMAAAQDAASRRMMQFSGGAYGQQPYAQALAGGYGQAPGFAYGGMFMPQYGQAAPGFAPFMRAAYGSYANPYAQVMM